MRKIRVKPIYFTIGLLASAAGAAWTYDIITNTVSITYLLDVFIIIMLLILLLKKNGRVKKPIDRNNYMEWITDGKVENCSKLSVGVKSLEDLAKLAADLGRRVIHDSRLGKYFVLTENMTYIHDPGLADPYTDNKQQIGRILIERGLIQPDQLEIGLYYQKRIGCKLGESLIALGFIDETLLYSTLAAQQNISYYELNIKKEYTDTGWPGKMSINKAGALQVLPLGYREDGKLAVACGEAGKPGITAALKEAFGSEICIVAARPSLIYEILDKLDHQKKQRSEFEQVPGEHKAEACKRLSDTELKQFTDEYYRGRINTGLFIKASGWVDADQLEKAPNQDMLRWLAVRELLNGQIVNLMSSLERLVSRQEENVRRQRLIPDLPELLEGACYITPEAADWIHCEHSRTNAPVEKLLECNYMAAAETIEYAQNILDILKCILNRAEIL